MSDLLKSKRASEMDKTYRKIKVKQGIKINEVLRF